MKDYTARDRKATKKSNRMKSDKTMYDKRGKERRKGNSERSRYIEGFNRSYNDNNKIE